MGIWGHCIINRSSLILLFSVENYFLIFLDDGDMGTLNDYSNLFNFFFLLRIIS